jgi:putative flippase GtrA
MKRLVFRRKLPARVVLFTVVGGIGFLIDGGVLTLMVKVAHLNPYVGRLVSFPVAASVTWYLNRRWTFISEVYKRKAPEYIRYMVIQIIGAGINLATYALLILFISSLASLPILPLAAGALIAMVFNFLGLQFFVFRSTAAS